jgi:hypothetical protein
MCPVGGHKVLGLYCTQGNDVFIGASIAHDANRLYGQKYGECLIWSASKIRNDWIVTA